jgi:hypothetical protein
MEQPPKTTLLSVGVVIRHDEISSIEPYGAYADEVTLVMKNGKRYPAGSGYNKTRSETLVHWQSIMEAAHNNQQTEGT